MAQVKFYSVAADATRSDANGIYFVTGGELYKGTSRFGLGRVTTVEDVTTLTSAARGDININGDVTKVFDGTNWVVAASAFTLPAFTTGDADGQVKLGSVNATVNGWSGLVESVGANATAISGLSTTAGSLSTRVGTLETKVSGLETKVSGIESIVGTADGGTVTAASGVFTNLTVSDTATFSATTVSATTLTIGGSDISDLISAGADARISAAKLSGSISASNGTGLVNEGQVVTYVSAAIQSFDNAMHYIGITETSDMAQGWTGTPTITGKTYTEKKAGDIVLMGTQEYIWNGSAWELIGDQGTYATKGELSELSASLSLLTGSLGTAAFVDTSTAVTANATTLPTGGAVASYVAGVIDGLAGSASDSDKGIAVEVVTADGEVSSVDVGVTLDTDIGPSTGTGAATDTEIPSSLAVRKAIESAISDATLVWLDANGDAIS